MTILHDCLRFDSFLRDDLGTNLAPHSGRTLYDHLVGTHDLLCRWGNEEAVRNAGLFHSVYGTSHFKHQSIDPSPANRKRIARLIGEKAEMLVLRFCTMNRPDDLLPLRHPGAVSLERPFGPELREIEVANLIEQGGGHDTLRRLREAGVITRGAAAAIDKVLETQNRP